MSSAYDIDAINRMLGLDNDGDVTTAVLPASDDHDATQPHAEPWLPDDLPVRVTQLSRVTERTPVAILPPSAPARFTQVTQPGQKTNLMDAHRQWASRPADERFWNLEELIQRTSAGQRSSREIVVDPKELKVVSDGTDLQLVGGSLNGPARFTHWSFGQLSRLAGAPADYLRTLDGDLASECLNRGLQKRTESGKAGSHVLVRNAGTANQTVGAMLSNGYSRIWNHDVVKRLVSLEQSGWRVPPARPASHDDPRSRPATQADVLQDQDKAGGLAVRVGDMIAPAGLYASDRDCFVFMINENNRIDAGGGDSGLARGFFMSNSEVGDCAFRLTTFLYDYVCSNHILWGASNVHEVRIVHRGRANDRWVGDLRRSLDQYSQTSAATETRVITAAMRQSFGDTREEVVQKLHKMGLTTVKNAEAALKWAEVDSDLRRNAFSPLSVWGIVCGLTRVSQQSAFTDERVAIDRAAGKLMSMVC